MHDVIIFRTKWVNIGGTVYKRNAAVIVGKEENIEVLIISKILTDKNKKNFKGNHYQLDPYNRHYRSFTLSDLSKNTYVCYDNFYHHVFHPQSTRVLQQKTVILPFYMQ